MYVPKKISKPSAGRALWLNKERHWIPGFAARRAQETGILLTDAQVRRDPEYKNAVAVLRAYQSRPGHQPAANSKVAKALVTLGVRDPSFRGAVGNSPKAMSRQGGRRSRQPKMQHPRRRAR